MVFLKMEREPFYWGFAKKDQHRTVIGKPATQGKKIHSARGNNKTQETFRGKRGRYKEPWGSGMGNF